MRLILRRTPILIFFLSLLSACSGSVLIDENYKKSKTPVFVPQNNRVSRNQQTTLPGSEFVVDPGNGETIDDPYEYLFDSNQLLGQIGDDEEVFSAIMQMGFFEQIDDETIVDMTVQITSTQWGLNKSFSTTENDKVVLYYEDGSDYLFGYLIATDKTSIFLDGKRKASDTEVEAQRNPWSIHVEISGKAKSDNDRLGELYGVAGALNRK